MHERPILVISSGRLCENSVHASRSQHERIVELARSSTRPFALSLVEGLRLSFHTVWQSERSCIFSYMRRKDFSPEFILSKPEGARNDNTLLPGA